ncbi:MAG: hypothetical protein KF838_07335 [Phycisphaeraceae bacterium]|nr:MAG: hypothetical protein KF838_07335 [Phycisphaeraceae bacterium]
MVEQAASTASQCPRCRYDLAGLPPDTPCPECQLPAEAIRSPMPIVIAETAQIRWLARLIDVLGEVLVIWTSLSLLFSFVGQFSGYGHFPLLNLTHEWGGRAAWLLIAALIIGTACADRSMLRPPSFRRVWWLLAAGLASTIYSLALILVARIAGLVGNAVGIVMFIIHFAASPILVLTSVYLSRVATAAAEGRLSRRLRVLAWILGAFLVAAFGLDLAWMLELVQAWLWAGSKWWGQYVSMSFHLALGLFAVRLARHLRGPVLAEATRVRGKP